MEIENKSEKLLDEELALILNFSREKREELLSELYDSGLSEEDVEGIMDQWRLKSKFTDGKKRELLTIQGVAAGLQVFELLFCAATENLDKRSFDFKEALADLGCVLSLLGSVAILREGKIAREYAACSQESRNADVANKDIHEILTQRLRKLAVPEIRDAVYADKKNRKFPPLRRLSLFLRDKNLFNYFSDEDVKNLADFLEGKHRGKRGEKKDKIIDKNTDIDRFNLYLDYLEETKSRAKALEKLADHEHLEDIRSVERSISRALDYIDEDIKKHGGKTSVKNLHSARLKELRAERKKDDGT